MDYIEREDLKIGQIVEARFTNNFNKLRFKGEVVKINQNTARVKSLVDGVNGWDKGHEFIIELEDSQTFSPNNCLKRFDEKTYIESLG